MHTGLNRQLDTVYNEISNQVFLLTKAGFDAAGIDPNYVSFAGMTPEGWSRIGS